MSRLPSRWRSPPPPSPTTQMRGSLYLLEGLGKPVLCALIDICQDISAFHRILFSQLLVVTAAVELLRPDQTDHVLSVLLGVVKLALVVDCISIVTHHLIQLSVSNKVLDFVLYRTPLVTGPLSELALAMLMLKDGATSTAKNFLIGCVYVKPLLAGALCLGFYGPRPGSPGIQSQTTELPIVSQFFLVGGVLVMVSAPTVESDSPWLSRGVPLFLMLHVGFSFYFACWNAARPERRGNSNRAMRRERDEATNNGEWVVFLVSLAAFKVGAVLLVRSILNHARAISLTLGPSGASVASSLVVEFAAIPLAVTAVDHLADINAAYKGGIHGPWASLCQSTLQTYFFVRPLLTLAGHNINPQDGRMGIALCFLGIAVWLSLPSISRPFKGLVLLLAYLTLSLACVFRPISFETYVL